METKNKKNVSALYFLLKKWVFWNTSWWRFLRI